MKREDAIKIVRSTLYEPPPEPFTPPIPSRAEIYARDLVGALEALGLLKLDDSANG